jgi:hypothetical protein
MDARFSSVNLLADHKQEDFMHTAIRKRNEKPVHNILTTKQPVILRR